MSQKFNDQVSAAMRRLGFTVDTYVSYSYGRITVNMKDGTPEVRFEHERGRQEGQVKFLDSTFSPSKKTGDYDADRAVGLILKHIQETLQQRKRDAELEVKRQERRERQQWAEEVDAAIQAAGEKDVLTVGTPWELEKTYYALTFKSHDRATILAAIDLLRDHFIHVTTPPAPAAPTAPGLPGDYE